MNIFIIATKRESISSSVLKFRVVDINTREVRELAPQELESMINNSEESFHNIFRGTNKGKIGFRFDTGLDNLPIVDIENNLLSINKYVVISKVLQYNQYVISEYTGKVETVYKRKLEYLGSISGIANMKFSGERHKERQLERAVDILNFSANYEDKAFKKSIDNTYNIYKAKALVLGNDWRFKYKVVGHDVILTKYIGTSVNVTLPKFITIIGFRAFDNKDIKITTIQLNEGLKVIDNLAFKGNKLKGVEIPSTVEVVGDLAFKENTFSQGSLKMIMVGNNRELRNTPSDYSKLKQLNKDTIVIKE